MSADAMSQQMPALIVVFPLMGSIVTFLAGWWYQKGLFAVVMVSLTASLIFSILLAVRVTAGSATGYHVAGWPPPVGIAYRIDHFACVMLVLTSFLGVVTAVWAKKSVVKELGDRIFLFWSLYLLLMTGLFGIVVTGDLFNLFVLLEVASLAGYALVAVGGRKATVAGFRYLIIGTIGACFYLLGVGYLYIKTGTLNMADLAQSLPALYDSKTVVTAFVFILSGFSIKIALFPLHAWQPDAYTHAPSGVSIIISTAAAKTFAYALVRVVFSVFTVGFIKTVMPVFQVICWLGAAAIVVGSVYAIIQDNLKRMLAYSSIANVGYIVLGVGLAVSTSLGLTPAVMHIINHAVIKGALFMAACGFIHRYDLWHISDLKGVSRRMPYTSLALIIASLAMIGLPPGAGFVSKWYLILAAIEAGQYLFVVVIFVSTLLMLVYFWRIIETMYVQPVPAKAPSTSNPDSKERVGELPLNMMIPCAVMAGLTFLMGILWISGALAPLLKAINLDLALGGVR